MVAHRGLSGLEPENSIPAFVAGGNRSYYGIETDVHVTGDGKFVTIHDENTVRTAGDNINVKTSSTDLIKKICLYNLNESDRKAGLKGNDTGKRPDLIIPSLADYINICKKYDKKCILELKGPFKEEDLERMVEEIKGLGYIDGIIFISFAYQNLVILRKLLADQPLQLLTGVQDQPLSELIDKLNRHNLDLDVYCKGLTKEVVDEVHANNHKVNCWVCDTKEEAEMLIEWGVDFITTNILE